MSSRLQRPYITTSFLLIAPITKSLSWFQHQQYHLHAWCCNEQIVVSLFFSSKNSGLSTDHNNVKNCSCHYHVHDVLKHAGLSAAIS